MPKTKKIILVFTVVSAVILSAGAWLFRGPFGGAELKDELSHAGFITDLDGLTVRHRQVKNILKREVTEFDASGGSVEVKALYVPGMPPAAAEKYLNHRLFMINSQFNPKESAYPGAISKQVECDARFLPKIDQVSGAGWKGVWVQASATRRKRLGDCDPTEQHYAVGVLIAHCADAAKIFDLEIYEPLGSAPRSEAVSRFTCRP